MLIVAVKPGHDGAVAVLDNRHLKFSLESEKDSYVRHKALTVETLLTVSERLDAVPDVIAMGGWQGAGGLFGRPIGQGYHGADRATIRSARLFGRNIDLFSSSHERSHIMMALGMAPAHDAAAEAVLVWEGIIGAFYYINHVEATRRPIPVLTYPGVRYGLAYTIADPRLPDSAGAPLDGAGKLMALAAYGDPKAANSEIHQIVDRLLAPQPPLLKRQFADTILYNAGVESEVCKVTAALLTERMFKLFATAAEKKLPAGLPLRISGGCGLNCDWNSMWRALEHFDTVFVPPCTNDAGSALGTAIDALGYITGNPQIDWNVYGGLEFEVDTQPDPIVWMRRPRDAQALAAALSDQRIVAWVQGRWEIGPRALGHRSLLAEPFDPMTRDRLNKLKQREGYRPIAPICRLEDASTAFIENFPDPYMLYFRKVRDPELRAVTHVDGSARAQTVTASENPAIHELLTAFARRNGTGVLCNTSLNFHGYGFINRMSDLIRYCNERGIDDFVVDDNWYQRRETLDRSDSINGA